MSSVFITCAVTGAGDTVGKSDKVPVTPQQIADDCIAAARAGAAVVHIHVRDPITGQGARHPDLYAEVVERVRSSDVDVVLNLTADARSVPDAGPGRVVIGTHRDRDGSRVESAADLRPNEAIVVESTA